MAGIGFKLERILREDSYTSLVRAYVYSAAVSAGPWMFTVLAVAVVSLVTTGVLPEREGDLFRALTGGVYALSLVASGPVQMVASRFLADRLWVEDVDAILPAYGALSACAIAIQALLALSAVAWLGIPPPLAAATVALHAIVGGLWITLLFLSAARDYERVGLAFALGGLVSIVGAAALAPRAGSAGCMLGFAAGQLLTLVVLAARLFREFDARTALDPAVLGYLPKHWDLALAGFAYNLGIWIDKPIMAASRDLGIEIVPGLRTNPVYEGGLLLAYLSFIPALALFTIRIETTFHASYRDFFRAILAHRPLDELRDRGAVIAARLRQAVVSFLEVQATVTGAAMALGAPVLDACGLDPLIVMCFRTAALGAFLHVAMLLATIGLLYFEQRRAVVLISIAFAVLNAVGARVTVAWGVAWYGTGYAAACLVCTAAAFLALDRAVARLDYETFSRQRAGTPA